MHLLALQVGILGTVPLVAATIPIAVGAALAASLRRSDRVSVSFFGDGAVEEGTFHESMNFAALKKLPVIFVCENNFFSSHLPLQERRAKDNIVDYARPHGMPGFRIDGNNATEVFKATRTAVNRARAGEGPTFLECRTYRWRGHVGPKWDLDVGIRSKAELDAWMEKCPIRMLELNLLQNDLIAEAEKNEIRSHILGEIQESVDFAQNSPYPRESEAAYYVFKD